MANWRDGRRDGFTLVEVLVALAIIAIGEPATMLLAAPRAISTLKADVAP